VTITGCNGGHSEPNPVTPTGAERSSAVPSPTSRIHSSPSI
jgi:hypothetical protein